MYTDPSGYQYDFVSPESTEIMQMEMAGNRNTGFRENFNLWSAHQGSIKYNDADGKFYYSSGAEASWGEARRYLYSGSHVYYYSQGQQAIDFYKTTPLYLNGRGKVEATTKRQLANIDASAKEIISKIPAAMDLMITGSKMFIESNNVGNFTYISLNGTEALFNTGIMLRGIEIAAKSTFVVSVFVDTGLALSGNKEAQRFLVSNSVIGYIALTTGPTGIIIGLTYFVLKECGAFNERPFFDYHYNPNNIIPQDAIKNYLPRDGYKTIYLNH